jgi:hypothetical protein
MFNVVVVVSVEFRRTRLEKSCNFICLSSLNKVSLSFNIGLISVRCDYQGLVCLDLMLIYLGGNFLGCLL